MEHGDDNGSRCGFATNSSFAVNTDPVRYGDNRTVKVSRARISRAISSYPEVLGA